MKKVFYTIICCFVLLVVVGCNIQNDDKLNILVPSGTPSLIVARMMYEEQVHKETLHQIVHGADPLVAAFTSSSYDIIYAPTNLGALMYQNNANYILGAVVVWGNNFIVSRPNANINQVSDLVGQKIYAFGRNQTPDIVLKTVLTHYDILQDVEIDYGNDITTVTSKFLAGQLDVILCAEPSLSLIRKTTQVNVIDLQDEWEIMSGEVGYPQVGIFINQESYRNNQVAIEQYLTSVETEIQDFTDDSLGFSEIAILAHETFTLLGTEVIISSIQSTQYYFKTAQQSVSSCESYFSQILLINPNLIGGSMPDASFYKQE